MRRIAEAATQVADRPAPPLARGAHATPDRPIKVLMITTNWPRQGQPATSHFIKRQAEFLRAAGVDVDVFHFRGHKNVLSYVKAWVEVRRKLRSNGYDLIHAQFGQSGLMALPKTIPYVVTLRGSDILGTVSDVDGRYTRAGMLNVRLSRLVADKADAVILVSAHMASRLRRSGGVKVIPSGIDFDLFRCVPARAARRRIGLPEQERLVLFVGNPAQARKRFHLAQAAVDIVAQRLPCRLILAWGVPHDEIPTYMSACDALVFTSMQEGSPNVVKEALACNLPVVSVPVGDVAERLGPVDGCEVCADDEPRTIADSLERVLMRGGRVRGRQAVRHLSEERTTREVLSIYRSIFSQANAPRAA